MFFGCDSNWVDGNNKNPSQSSFLKRLYASREMVAKLIPSLKAIALISSK
jgi:hypothetical protein